MVCTIIIVLLIAASFSFLKLWLIKRQLKGMKKQMERQGDGRGDQPFYAPKGI